MLAIYAQKLFINVISKKNYWLIGSSKVKFSYWTKGQKFCPYQGHRAKNFLPVIKLKDFIHEGQKFEKCF